MIKKLYRRLDYWLITLFKKISLPLARLAIFIVFAWFGYLKIIGVSAANPLVNDLLERTLPFITFDQFIVLFGIYEILIGFLFIVPKMERLAIFLLIPHLVMTSLPLFMLKELGWESFGVPTLEGQYIIKNLALIALAFSIAAHLHPRRVKSQV